MSAYRMCNVITCPLPAEDGSHWCSEHRDLFYRAGRCRPPEDIAQEVYALILSETERANVATVEDIAAHVGCTEDEVRTALQGLRRAGKALPWLPGPMRQHNLEKIGA